MPWLFVVAVAAVALGAFLLYGAHKARRATSDLVSVETSPTSMVHELHRNALSAAGPGAFRERVEVAGTVVAGPQGVLRAEVSGTECVWHRHRVTRHYEEVRRDSEGRRRTSQRTDEMTDAASREPFVVRDEHGEITVVPTHGVPDARKSVSEFRDREQDRQGTELRLGSFSLSLPTQDRGGTLGYEYEEWVLAPGTRVFVSADAVDHDGTLELRAPEGGRLLVSTRSEEELLEGHRSSDRRGTLLGWGGIAVGVVAAIAGLVTTLL